MKRFLAPAALVLAAVAMVLAVRRDLQEPHWRLFNDMVYSKAYKSQMPNSVLPGGRTEQPPVPGTIPRGYMPLPYGPGAAGRELAGRELKNPLLPTYQNLIQGKQLFQAYCSHCHGQEGLGDGPVAKLFPAFSFPIATPSVYALKDGTIFDVITYGFNMMPAHGSQIPQKDRWKIILYLRNLQRQEIARHAYPRSPLEDSRRDSLVSAGYGKELFAQHCAVCHGQEGLHPQHGVPTLHQPSVLAVADNNYYRQTITHGRAGTAMPAWGGALTPTQIESLVRYIRSWATPAPSAASLVAARGDAVQGKALFAKRCAGCHGRNGQGGIGNSLNGPAFLSIASKRFLRETIAWGRPHTAMPAAYGLKASDVADLSAAIQSWRSRPPSWSRVQRLLPRVTNAQGARVFAMRCAGCHGQNGDGGIGSRLNSPSFLSMADNHFLYNVITEGRPQTAMPAWRQLSAAELAAVITHIRSWQTEPSVALSNKTISGDPKLGQALFKANCQKCHMAGGSGDVGAQIGNPTFGTQVSDDFLFQTIAHGKRGTEMKGFLHRDRDPLSVGDIDNVIAYLRQIQRHPPAEILKPTFSWSFADDGNEIFHSKAGCAKCHGEHAQGGSGPSLGAPGFQRVASAGFIAATLVLGRDHTPMPSFYSGKVHLSEDDIESVATYLMSFSGHPPVERREVDRSPALALRGRALFKQNCARCHGEGGLGKHGLEAGDYGPSLHNPGFLKAADDNFLLATIAMGRPGTPMPPFALGAPGVRALSADEIREIVAYLRTWETGKPSS